MDTVMTLLQVWDMPARKANRREKKLAADRF
jgi:hypothetical protein